MFQKITITNDNYATIIYNIGKVCKKWKMITLIRDYINVYTDIGFVKIQSESDSTIKQSMISKISNKRSSFFCVTDYTNHNALIKVNISGSESIIIRVGDSITFLPFGGFEIITNEKGYVYGVNYIHKYICIPDKISGKIKNMTYETCKRNMELSHHFNRIHRDSIIL